MKPHLRLNHGVWSCYVTLAIRYTLVGVAGYGYTFRDAYLDWQRELRNARKEVPHD